MTDRCEGKGYWWPPYVGGDDDGPELCPDCGGTEAAAQVVEEYLASIRHRVSAGGVHR